MKSIQIIKTDQSTGEETISHVVMKWNKGQEVHFAFTFVELVGHITNLGANLGLLLVLALLVDHKTGVCYLTSGRRAEIRKVLGITDGTLRNRISELKKKGYIVIEGGNVSVTPKLFWRGKLSDRLSRIHEDGKKGKWKDSLVVELGTVWNENDENAKDKQG